MENVDYCIKTTLSQLDKKFQKSSLYLEDIEKWNKYIQSSIPEGSRLNRFYEYVSPIHNSLGYPPSAFDNWRHKKTISIRLLTQTFYSLASASALILKVVIAKLTLRKQKEIFLKSDIVQYQYQYKAPRRKDLAEIGVKKLINDIDLNFCQFKDIFKLKKSKDVAASFAMLSWSKIVSAVFLAMKTLHYDSQHYLNLLLLERNAFQRTLSQILKIYSIDLLLQINPTLKIIFFWENRGFQNYFLLKYPQRCYAICLGAEGIVGPIYINHQTMKFSGKFFFDSKWTYDLLKNRVDAKAILATLPSWLIKTDSTIRSKKNETDKVLYLLQMDKSHYDLAIRLALQNKSLFLKPHPAYVAKFPKAIQEQIEVRSLNECLHLYDSFVYSSTTNSAFWIFLLNKKIFYFDISGRENFLAPLEVNAINKSEFIELLNGHSLQTNDSLYNSKNSRADIYLGDVRTLTPDDFFI